MVFLFSSSKRFFFHHENRKSFYAIFFFTTIFIQSLFTQKISVFASEKVAQSNDKFVNKNNGNEIKIEKSNIQKKTNTGNKTQVNKSILNKDLFVKEFNYELEHQSDGVLNKMIDKIETKQGNKTNNQGGNELLDFWDFQAIDGSKNGWSNTYAGMVGDKRLGRGINLDITLEQKGDCAWLLVIDGKKVEDSKLVNAFLQENPTRFIIDVNTALLKDKVVNFTYQIPKEIRLRYGRQSFGYRVAIDLPIGVKIASKKIATHQISVKLVNVAMMKEDELKTIHNNIQNRKDLGSNNDKNITSYTLSNVTTNAKLKKIHLGKQKPFTIAIDAGHGGIDPGAKGKSGIFEKDITLRYAKQLKDKLQKKGFKVILTREKDKTLPLSKRVEIAKRANADLFISLHTDANEQTKIYGTTVYRLMHLDKNNDEWNRFYNYSYLPDRYTKFIGDKNILDILIGMTHQSLSEKATIITDNVLLTFKKDGICKKCRHGQRSLAVLRGLDLTSILIEIGYITNADEEKKLLDKTYVEKFSKSLAEVVVNTFEE